MGGRAGTSTFLALSTSLSRPRHGRTGAWRSGVRAVVVEVGKGKAEWEDEVGRWWKVCRIGK